MGLATDNWVAQSPELQAKVQSILVNFVDENSNSPSTPMKELIGRIVQSPERAAQLVTRKIVIADGSTIDIDSDRVALEAVILTSSTQAFLRIFYGLD